MQTESAPITGGLSGELHVTKTSGQTFEEVLTWSVDSQIQVAHPDVLYSTATTNSVPVSTGPDLTGGARGSPPQASHQLLLHPY